MYDRAENAALVRSPFDLGRHRTRLSVITLASAGIANMIAAGADRDDDRPGGRGSSGVARH